MKNLGIKTKKIVRKITAIASAALMAGMSLGVATADLANLSDTFVSNGHLNAYVVLGTGGATNVVGFAKDVAGAIVVGSALAQQAKTSTASSGSATLERNITTGYLNSSTRGYSFPLWNGKSVEMSWNNAETGFSWLPNQTVSNATGVIANMTGILKVQDYSVTSQGIKTNEEGMVKLYPKGLIYNLTFQDFVSGYSGVGKNTTGIVLPGGDTYKITGWTTDGTTERITLGDFNEVSAAPSTVYDIGSTGATFEITGYSDSPSDKLKIKVVDSDGTVLKHDYIAAGDEVYSNDEFTLNLIEYFAQGGTVNSAKLEWSTGVLTLEEGNASKGIVGGENWTVRVGITTAAQNAGAASNDTRNISWIAWEFRVPESKSYIEVAPGSEVDFFGDYFKLKVDNLEINSTTNKEATITVKNDNDEDEFRLLDENDTLQKFDISAKEGLTVDSDYEVEFEWYLGNSSTGNTYKLTCDNSNPTKFNLSRGSEVLASLTNYTHFKMDKTTSLNLPYELHAFAHMYGNTSANCVGMKFNITALNFTSDAGVPLYNNLTWVGSNATTPSKTDFTDGTLNITEGNNRVEIVMDNGTIDSVDYYSGSAPHTEKISSTGDEYYTEYGTRLVRESGDEVSIYYPDTTRIVKLSLGQAGVKEYELSSGDYDSELDVTLKSAGGSSDTVNPFDVGLSKLDTEVSSSSLDKPVVLMGGWAVNSLVKELVDAGSVATTDLEADRALVQLVSGALNSQDALVIAGWTGDDTRLAAQVVASQILGTDMGLTGDKAILNTGVDSYSEVVVV